MAQKRLTQKELRLGWSDLQKGVTHSARCFCVSCLFHFYRLLPENKGSKLRKENFFVGYVLLATQKEKNGGFQTQWKSVNDLLPKISSRFCNLATDVFHDGWRYLKAVDRTCKRKLELYEEMVLPLIARGKLRPDCQIIDIIHTSPDIMKKAQLMAAREVLRNHLRSGQRVLNHIEKECTDAGELEASQRDISRRAAKSINELEWYLGFYERDGLKLGPGLYPEGEKREVIWDRTKKKISFHR